MAKLTPRKLKFAKLYVALGNQYEAAIEAGFSKSTARNAFKLLAEEEVQKAVKEAMQEWEKAHKDRFMRAVDSAIGALEELVITGRGMAKVAAANSILDRAGYKPTDRVSASIMASISAKVEADVKTTSYVVAIPDEAESIEQWHADNMEASAGTTN